ncbi:hypothetical protein [Streptomyces sp. bgisy022]|uniref:hypothetical protein n=1 Tax=Streptomyces sp. bgisy022 TaxID=3413769 RepID=UPI003D71ECFB
MRRRSGCAALALLLALSPVALFALDGCGAPEGGELSGAQVVGVWSGEGGATLEFGAGGRFEMTRIPREAIPFSDSLPGDGRLSGSGAWTLADSDRSGTIELVIDPGGSFADEGATALLQVKEAGKHPVMYFDTNPDRAYGYEVRRIGIRATTVAPAAR